MRGGEGIARRSYAARSAALLHCVCGGWRLKRFGRDAEALPGPKLVTLYAWVELNEIVELAPVCLGNIPARVSGDDRCGHRAVRAWVPRWG